MLWAIGRRLFSWPVALPAVFAPPRPHMPPGSVGLDVSGRLALSSDAVHVVLHGQLSGWHVFSTADPSCAACDDALRTPVSSSLPVKRGPGPTTYCLLLAADVLLGRESKSWVGWEGWERCR